MDYVSQFGAHVDSEPANMAWDRLASRWWSDRPIHRFSHRQKIQNILPLIKDYDHVMDVTRGASVDGILGVVAAGQGKRVTIVSPSNNHIAALRRFAGENGIDPSVIEFVHTGNGPLESLDVKRADCVTALHILEHATHPRSFLSFLRDRTSNRCILAVPTCANPTAWVRMGGDTDPYVFTAGSLQAAARGIRRTATAKIRGRAAVTEFVNEYGTTTVHRWFFPSALFAELEWSGFHIEQMRPDSLAIPWLNRSIQLSQILQDHLPDVLTSGLGFGTHFVLRPVPA
ncbi:class I SAM-dependent methyltransferase [Nocardia sp. NPDC051750]|uniref:class I SAM-dependent methyltransferase n=1 Tax=Nocardia sp. NPDC051750 TaxID=3364325 RepID=UPI0037A4E710